MIETIESNSHKVVGFRVTYKPDKQFVPKMENILAAMRKVWRIWENYAAFGRTTARMIFQNLVP